MYKPVAPALGSGKPVTPAIRPARTLPRGRTLGSAGTGSEWIMLELVFQWDGVGGAPGRVRATFRSDSNAALGAAARHFAESLGRTLGVAFGDGV